MSIIQENYWVITTKKGKGKLPLFCGNVERLIPIYGLKVQVLILLLRLCKSLFRSHSQVGAHIEVDHSNVKHCGGPPIPEAMVSYVCP